MKYKILKQYFGYDNFRKGQEQIVDGILSGRDVLGIMPTGAGKSICFQTPALIMQGITLVVSPLISLMQDQVKGLIQSGIKGAYINSSLSPRQIETALYNAKKGMYKIIYVAPERLLTDNFLSFAQSVNISMLTVDEAHCISQWGQDFRPSYAQIPEFIEKLQRKPVVSAFTATATEQVKEDIIKLLNLNNPLVLVSGFDRENLYFEVRRSKNKIEDLLEFLQDKKDKSGIVYCATRKNVEQVCEELNNHGFSVKRYHAGLDQRERQENQDEFIFDNTKIIVATNAFGMGIDKSNVNFVVHYNMPKDMESYYQEAGRAGRDGSPAHCLMLYSGQDVITNQFLIENSHDVEYENTKIEKTLKKLAHKRLKEITFYATSNECLRKYILNYFGDNAQSFCGNCNNCNKNFELFDASVEAKKIISCVIRVNERFGKLLIIDILKGSKNKRILELGFDKLSTYGISSVSSNRLRAIMDDLIFNGYLMQTDEQYSIIKTTKKSNDILNDKVKYEIRIAKEKMPEEINIEKTKKNKTVPEGTEELFEMLRNLRAKLAKEQSIPAFVVFGDFSLIDMCNKLPINNEQFLNVSGVGQAKFEKYGEEFINLIALYCQEHKISKTTNKIESEKAKTKTKKVNLILPTEKMIKEIEISNKDISVGIISENINIILEQYNCTKISAIKINNWLLKEGYLKIETNERGNVKVPTEKGFNKGIIQEEKTGKVFTYYVNVFPRKVQEFIIDNLLEIATE